MRRKLGQMSVVVALALLVGCSRSDSPVATVQPGDLLHIAIDEWGGPGQKFTQDVTVNEHGEIHVMNLGRMSVANLDLRALERKIADAAGGPQTPPASGPIVHVTRGPNSGPPRPLRAGDRIEVSVFELVTPGLWSTNTLTIDAEGNIPIPGLKNEARLHAAGLTNFSLEDRLQDVFDSYSRGLGPPKWVRDLGPDVIVNRVNK